MKSSAKLVMLFVVAGCLLAFPSGREHIVNAAGSGPGIAVVSPSLVNGKVKVPVYAWPLVGDAYGGFNLHLRWNPAVFSLSGADASGGLFDPGANPATGTCVGPSADSDGGGAIFACTGFAGTTLSGRLLATLTLTPATSGCSALHLFTYGTPDDGTVTTGSFTVNAGDYSGQTNRYMTARLM